jgi:hypothetical protein
LDKTTVIYGVSGHSKPPLNVETGHYLGVKTTLVGPITPGSEGLSNVLKGSLQHRCAIYRAVSAA